MKSIDFPKANVALAKDQPQYQTLFVHVDKTGRDREVQVTCCMELSEEEVNEIVRTKKMWFTQVTFGRGYNPIRMQLSSPFTAEESESNTNPMDENRTAVEEWNRTHFKGTEGTVFPGQGYVIHGPCSNCGRDETEHFWSSRQCKL